VRSLTFYEFAGIDTTAYRPRGQVNSTIGERLLYFHDPVLDPPWSARDCYISMILFLIHRDRQGYYYISTILILIGEGLLCFLDPVLDPPWSLRVLLYFHDPDLDRRGTAMFPWSCSWLSHDRRGIAIFPWSYSWSTVIVKGIIFPRFWSWLSHDRRGTVMFPWSFSSFRALWMK
jgi:hypothetical protein